MRPATANGRKGPLHPGRPGTEIVLATIDGGQTTSVGTTMAETATVAKALGSGPVNR